MMTSKNEKEGQLLYHPLEKQPASSAHVGENINTVALETGGCTQWGNDKFVPNVLSVYRKMGPNSPFKRRDRSRGF